MKAKRSISLKKVQIKPAKLTNIDNLADIYKNIYNNIAIEERWDFFSAKKLIHYYSSSKCGFNREVYYDKKLIGGFLSHIKPWWDGNHIFDPEIFINSEYQNMGIGQYVLEYILKEAKMKHNVTRMDAITYVGEGSPLNWYLKIGFIQGKYTFFSGNLEDVFSAIKKRT